LGTALAESVPAVKVKPSAVAIAMVIRAARDATTFLADIRSASFGRPIGSHPVGGKRVTALHAVQRGMQFNAANANECG
jgi:hypothetical protein